MGLISIYISSSNIFCKFLLLGRYLKNSQEVLGAKCRDGSICIQVSLGPGKVDHNTNSKCNWQHLGSTDPS